MDPREIVTGDVRQMTGKVTYASVRPTGITIRFCDGFASDYGRSHGVGWSRWPLVSRPMWGDQ